MLVPMAMPVEGMELRAPGTASVRRVDVRPVADDGERARWDALMRDHHHLGWRGMVGNGLRQVAVRSDGRWMALLGWRAGAQKLAARDRWIGWTAEQRSRRLHLVANNVRFPILPGAAEPNLASRILGLSLRRLSADMRAAHGHPVLLAETFVDPSRFTGASYRAAGWEPVGLTKGYERVPGGGYREHGEPKGILVRELRAGVRGRLSGLADDVSWNCPAVPVPEKWEPGRIRSLHEHLMEVPEYRARRGLRHRMATVLAIALAAQLSGASGPTAIAESARRLNQRQLAAVRSWRSPGGRRVAPGVTTFFRVLSSVDPKALDKALRDWIAPFRERGGALAVDGKRVRGASKRMKGADCHLVAAVEHRAGLVCGQVRVADKTNGIPALRELPGGIDIAGRVVTADPLHVRNRTARFLLDRGADYLVTVKGNRRGILDDIRAIDWGRVAGGEFGTVDKGHGRIGVRRCRAVELGPGYDGFANLPGRRQAFRIERTRTVKDATSTETAYGLTSLPRSRAGPAELLDLARRHWEIENRVHYVRDFSFDEDRRRDHVGGLPRNIACLRNAAISIVRLRGRFDFLPQAQRHYAANHADALREVVRRGFRI